MSFCFTRNKVDISKRIYTKFGMEYCTNELNRVRTLCGTVEGQFLLGNDLNPL